MTDNETTEKEEKRVAYAIMLRPIAEKERIDRVASKYGQSYSDWGRMLMLQACERDEQKEKKQ